MGVRDQRADQRQADLPTVRVPGDDEPVAAGDDLGRGVRRVRHRDPERRRGLPRRDAQVLSADVCVVQPEQLDGEAIQLELVAQVREVAPAVRVQQGPHLVGPPSTNASRAAATAVGDEVADRVPRPGDVVVVRTQDEPRGESPARGPDGGDGRLDRLGFGQEVTRHDGDVGGRERREEGGLAPIAADDVQVGQVQHRECLGSVGR